MKQYTINGCTIKAETYSEAIKKHNRGQGIARTKYISTKSPFARNLENYPSAGPNCNITGMKNKYWGKQAHCIKSGQYVYNVSGDEYGENLYYNKAY